MAFDDPVVWVLIIGVAVFLFGSSKIPALARSLGQARREFDMASKGLIGATGQGNEPNVAPPSVAITHPQVVNSDPLVVAAQNEGVNTVGKAREDIARELAWKLDQK